MTKVRFCCEYTRKKTDTVKIIKPQEYNFFFVCIDQDVEIDLVEEEPPFLRGQTKWTLNMSPVRIVKVNIRKTEIIIKCVQLCLVQSCYFTNSYEYSNIGDII